MRRLSATAYGRLGCVYDDSGTRAYAVASSLRALLETNHSYCIIAGPIC